MAKPKHLLQHYSAIIARIRDRLAISTGSACSSGVAALSRVLRAMNLSEELVEGSLRIGLGKFTTDKEIEQSVEIISDAVKKIDRLMYNKCREADLNCRHEDFQSSKESCKISIFTD
ncbi:MAG: hypothetical protein QNJ53_03160 [Pleurocapsa sp. MO_192.B19]|nr:hypothetical protein [Pleurocapsa sp. MO_192.B19]